MVWKRGIRIHLGPWILLFLCAACAKPMVPTRLDYLHYNGRVNEHRIAIQASPDRIFAILTDGDQFPHLVPGDRIRVTKITPEPYGVGTQIRTQTGYRIKLSWTSSVVDLQPGRRITLQFQNGIFNGGYEIWELQPMGDQTLVSHTILFNLSNFIYRVLWVVKNVEEKHNTLVEGTLCNLKQAAESPHTRSTAAPMQHP